MYQRILVATDGSKLSKKAVDDAIALAASLGAELIALKVVPRYPQSYFEGSMPLSVDEVARVEQHWADDGHEVVEAVKRAGAVKGVKVKPIIARSDVVSDALIAAAKKHKADLIVMASHGRSGLRKLLLGSQAQAVVSRGSLPVLVVR